jgi:O-antigen/teichoic acid export membrane protein
MNSKPKLFKNVLLYLSGNLINASIPFLLLPVLTRALSPEEYGRVAMFTVILSIMGALAGLSVNGAILVRYFEFQKQELSEYVGTCFGILSMSMTILLIGVLCIGKYLETITQIPTLWLLIAVILSALQFASNIRLSIWQADGKSLQYGIFQILQSLLNAGASLFLVLNMKLGWEGRLLGLSIAIFNFGIVAIWILRRDKYISISRKWKVHSSDALKFGVPLIPHAIGGLLLIGIERFIIVNQLDIARAGIYMVALQIGQALGVLTDSFNKAYAPWLFKKLATCNEIDKRAIVRGTYTYFVTIFLIASVVGLSASSLLEHLVGQNFQAAAGLVWYIALGFAFGGCYYMVTNYVFFMSQTSRLAIVTFLCGAINIPLTIYLIKVNGIIGASQSFMLTHALLFFGTWFLAHRYYPMPWMRAIWNRSPKLKN